MFDKAEANSRLTAWTGFLPVAHVIDSVLSLLYFTWSGHDTLTHHAWKFDGHYGAKVDDQTSFSNRARFAPLYLLWFFCIGYPVTAVSRSLEQEAILESQIFTSNWTPRKRFTEIATELAQACLSGSVVFGSCPLRSTISIAACFPLFDVHACCDKCSQFLNLMVIIFSVHHMSR